MTPPFGLWSIRSLVDHCSSIQQEVHGQWVPAKPMILDTLTERLRRAWWAFTLRADLFVWDVDTQKKRVREENDD